MIYRIAIGTIVGGKWKFDHYANDINLLSLRITPDGRVEMIDRIFHPLEHEEYDLLQLSTTLMCGYHIGACDKQIWLRWEDVSETHKVEWGFVANGNKYYHNDICKSVTSLSSYDPIGTLFNIEYDNDTASFWLTSEHDSEIQISVLCPILDECIKVIGNINKIPEILEKS